MSACFLVCSPLQRGAIQPLPWANRHVLAVALYGDGVTIGLRFEFLRFRAGGRNGRGSRTPIQALPGELTVMPPVRDSKAMLVWAAKPVVGLGQFVPVFKIFVLSAVSWTCDATWWLKARREQSDGRGRRATICTR